MKLSQLIRLAPLAGLLCLTALKLTAEEAWSGKIVYDVKTSDYKTELRIFTDGSAWRYEMGSPDDPHTVWLVLPGSDDTYELSRYTKTYSVVPDPAEVQGMDGMPSSGQGRKGDKPREFSVESLGRKEIQGRDCQGFKISSEGPDTEIWMAPVAAGYSRQLFLLFLNIREVAPGLAQLPEDGLGLPILVSRKSWMGRNVFRMELSEVQAEPVPESLFTFPEDYRRVGADVRPEKRGWH